MRHFFSTDGEADILYEGMTAEVTAAFAEARIDYDKNGPSATSGHQANDRADTFKDVRRGVKTVTENGTDCTPSGSPSSRGRTRRS
jgi:hypothetical protein